ncbi:hypothetical protein BDY19DRAFT_995395 [Irpex rosettiformis]|uniref:Uncharacterized protein n=1 Tax=Irpex rosettiformis TaxID=378272 RepID=A0ACB8TYD6_9APHY|nr:hypothetical protein BDY19DRAFT_995395 [Irpex rosettiformis]
MSYGNQNTGWDNDPSNLSNTTGERQFGDDSFDNPTSATGFERGMNRQTGQGLQQSDDVYSGDTSDMNAFGAGSGRERGMYAGDISDISTSGAGGDFAGRDTGRDSGRMGGQDWDNPSSGQQAYGSDTADYDMPGSGTGSIGNKPSMGDRLKGTAEKMTGRLTGNQSMAERGQERKEGDFERDY